MGEIKMDDKYEFDELERKYRDFFAPAFEVIIDGTNLLAESIAIPSCSVDTTVDPKADSVTFIVTNSYDPVKRQFRWLDQYLELGKYVEIKMGYVDKLETVFYGIITSINFEYPEEDNPQLVIRGMDISFLMMKGIRSNSWKDKKHSEVAKIIGGRYVSKMLVDDTEDELKIVAQNALEDFHFLTYLAEENNFDFFIVGRTMHFRKAMKNKTPVVTLQFGKNLKRFSADVNLAKQVSQVIIRGWDESNGKVIEATSKEINKLGTNAKTGKDIVQVLGDFTKEYMYTNVDSLQEAQDKADAKLNKRSMELINGDGECLGIPEIRAGKYIEFTGLGDKFNQPLYLKSVTHTINVSGYMTSFNVGGNAI